MIKFDPNASMMPNPISRVGGAGSIMPNASKALAGAGGDKKSEFANTIKAVEKYISNVDELQKSSDTSIMDLLSGKSEDITSVVSAVAKADVSFKLLVGVRNKLIEAYKQTMNMPL